MDKPQPPPEAVLIRRARLAGQVKAPAAARAAGISIARWSQIENGYERRDGEYKPVRASDGLLAHMAHAVGVTPERLDEAGRSDAAEILREIGRRGGPDTRPAVVQENWDHEYVRRLWGLTVDADQRLSLIEDYLRDQEAARAAR
jgi:transcriptional regulator with XRE-family HTH domain